MFEFQAKPTISICGADYECDVTNNAFIESLTTDFPKIIGKAYAFKQLQSDAQRIMTEGADEDQLTALQQSMQSLNREITQLAAAFITGALGAEAYSRIFSGRATNSTEHIQLCTALFEFVVKEREPLVNAYLDMPKNRSERRAADKAAPKDSELSH